VVFMDGGVVVEEGPPRQVIDNPQNDRTRTFLRRMQAEHQYHDLEPEQPEQPEQPEHAAQPEQAAQAEHAEQPEQPKEPA
jgi:ABC-type glutathione transport system ATPase component